MSVATVAAALAAFDDSALEALANKGLVRRASKDVESGKCSVRDGSASPVAIAVDGETVHIDERGPRAAKCSCPAPGVCRHKIAAVLALRSLVGAPPEEDSRRPAERADPLAEILALDPDAIAKWAGKPNLRAAAELLAEAGEPEIRAEGAAVVIRLGKDEPEVRYLAGQGLDGMVSKAPKARIKALHGAAVLAVRRVHGAADPSAGVEPPASGGGAPDAEFLAQVSRALEDATFSAFNQAPQALEERLFSLSISSRADDLPRLGRQLRLLAATLRQKREREFTFSPSAALSQLASAFALTEALGRPQSKEKLAELKGTARQDYVEAGDITLFGLGATLWRTQTGGRGVTGYFYSPERSSVLMASLARANARDPAFDPERSYADESLWRAAPLRTLIRSKLQLSNAKISADRRLSQGGDTRAIASPWMATREACQNGQQDWPILFSDWGALEATLRGQFHEQLSVRRQTAVAVILAPARHAQAWFDVNAQEHLRGLADDQMRWIGLSLRHRHEAQMAAARLQRLSELGEIQTVLAEARAAGSGFELTPIAAVAQMPSVGKFALFNLDLETGGAELPSAAMRAHWFSHIARKPKGAPPVNATLEPASPDAATSRLLAHCANSLLTVVELGAARLSDEQVRRFQAQTLQLEALGLQLLADAFRLIAQGETRCNTSVLLRAVHVLDRLSGAGRALPWLRQCG